MLNATSRWCMVDMHTGKLLQSKVLDNQDYSSYNPSRALDINRWKFPPFRPEEGELRFSMTVANSEYDHNMHVNNTRYADYCFNCFSVAELKEKKLKGFALGYIRQCREGDALRFLPQTRGERRVFGAGLQRRRRGRRSGGNPFFRRIGLFKAADYNRKYSFIQNRR